MQPVDIGVILRAVTATMSNTSLFERIALHMLNLKKKNSKTDNSKLSQMRDLKAESLQTTETLQCLLTSFSILQIAKKKEEKLTTQT